MVVVTSVFHFPSSLVAYLASIYGNLSERYESMTEDLSATSNRELHDWEELVRQRFGSEGSQMRLHTIAAA